MWKTGVVTVFLVCVVTLATGFEQRRCFRCRSRGRAGDCQDTFVDAGNLTAINGQADITGIKVEPCASGWCGKLIEGDTDINDYDTATERMCMQRPPSDLKQRCDLTKYGRHRTVFLCMCHGDLCNASGALYGSMLLVATALQVLIGFNAR